MQTLKKQERTIRDLKQASPGGRHVWRRVPLEPHKLGRYFMQLQDYVRTAFLSSRGAGGSDAVAFGQRRRACHQLLEPVSGSIFRVDTVFQAPRWPNKQSFLLVETDLGGDFLSHNLSRGPVSILSPGTADQSISACVFSGSCRVADGCGPACSRRSC